MRGQSGGTNTESTTTSPTFLSNDWSLKIMTQRDGYPEGDAATLNDARQKPLVSRRRIEHLKALAYDCGLTAEEARKHGKLTATATWELLLNSHGLEFDRKLEKLPNTV